MVNEQNEEPTGSAPIDGSSAPGQQPFEESHDPAPALVPETFAPTPAPEIQTETIVEESTEPVTVVPVQGELFGNDELQASAVEAPDEEAEEHADEASEESAEDDEDRGSFVPRYVDDEPETIFARPYEDDEDEVDAESDDESDTSDESDQSDEPEETAEVLSVVIEERYTETSSVVEAEDDESSPDIEATSGDETTSDDDDDAGSDRESAPEGEAASDDDATPDNEAASDGDDASPESEEDEPHDGTPEASESELTENAESAEGESVVPVPGAITLPEIVERTRHGRLSIADEQAATELIKAVLCGSKTDVVTGTGFLPHLPWSISVKAVNTVWPNLKAGMRALLVRTLNADECEPALRTRLSIARGLVKTGDMENALKLASGAVKDMRDKSGLLHPAHATIFGAIFVGKGKPWLVQLPLEEMKSVEADALVQVALACIFDGPYPPVSQLAIMKWAADAKRLKKLPEAISALILGGLQSWSGKWQTALRNEVQDLPTFFVEALTKAAPEIPRPPAPAPQPQQAPAQQGNRREQDSQSSGGGSGRQQQGRKGDHGGKGRGGRDGGRIPLPRGLEAPDEIPSAPESVAPAQPVDESASRESRAEAPDRENEDREREDFGSRESQSDRDRDRDDDDDDDENDNEAPTRQRREGGSGGQRREYPVYVSKTMPNRQEGGRQEGRAPAQQPQGGHSSDALPPQQGKGRSALPFNLGDSLRQIDSYVAGLRSELVQTQNKLRSLERDKDREKERDRDKDRGRPQRKDPPPIVEGQPTPDELARINVQLETRMQEMQIRINEMAIDAEDRAATLNPENPDAQLRAYLALKLKEGYQDFLALEQEKPDVVVQQHYRTLLREVFDILLREGVQLSSGKSARSGNES